MRFLEVDLTGVGTAYINVNSITAILPTVQQSIAHVWLNDGNTATVAYNAVDLVAILENQ